MVQTTVIKWWRAFLAKEAQVLADWFWQFVGVHINETFYWWTKMPKLYYLNYHTFRFNRNYSNVYTRTIVKNIFIVYLATLPLVWKTRPSHQHFKSDRVKKNFFKLVIEIKTLFKKDAYLNHSMIRTTQIKNEKKKSFLLGQENVCFHVGAGLQICTWASRWRWFFMTNLFLQIVSKWPKYVKLIHFIYCKHLKWLSQEVNHCKWSSFTKY